MNHRLQRLALLGATVCVLGLSGCGDRLSDLQQYANEVKARKGGHIEPLPQIKPFETYTYADQDQRSPFTQQLSTAFGNSNQFKGTSVTGLHPDFNRSHEYLEQ